MSASEIDFQITFRQEGNNMFIWQSQYQYAILRAKKELAKRLIRHIPNRQVIASVIRVIV